MTLSRRILAGLVLSASLLGGRAEACTLLVSPHAPGSPEAIAEDRENNIRLAKAIAPRELVFVGRVIRQRLPTIAEIQLTEFEDGYPPSVRSWFQPERVLKGTADLPTTNIFSGMYGSSCGSGRSLEVGSTVVVYAKRVDGYWYGNTTTMEILPYLEPLLR